MKKRLLLLLPLLVLSGSLVAQASEPIQSAEKKLVIIGDSLSEGYGVEREQAYPALLQKKIQASGRHWSVVNSGISGSTTASAPQRVTWALKQKPDLLILALGANDGLRGAPIKSIEGHLNQALDAAQKAKVLVVLVGMKVPPNYGKPYGKEFDALFPRLAKRYKVPFIPFLLEGVAGKPELNQADGIHPNEKGHAILAETVFKAIKRLL